MTKTKRKRSNRTRHCTSCGKIEIVRSDNLSVRCKSCAARTSGAKGIVTRRRIAASKLIPCEVCGTSHRNHKFCSRACKAASAPRVSRQCRYCDERFNALESALKTNASGNFCSRPCYENFLCRTERTTGRGSQWKKARTEAIRRAPFCAMCGTIKRLQVHHIIPFRLTQDNRQRNLIPLCVTHHRFVETLLVSTEAHGFDETAQMAWAAMLRGHQMTTAAKIKSLVANNAATGQTFAQIQHERGGE